MGRHTAADGSSVHPLVAEALAQRPADAVGAHRDGAPRAAGEGDGLGWPGPPSPGGGGLGWPGDASATDPSTSSESERSARPERPRGWRRFLGLRSAA